MEDCYLSVLKPTTGIYKEKASKFLSFVYPVSTETEIKGIINSLKKEHHSARHHCFAYRLGVDKKVFRLSDDGEPSGTAGKPIMGQIISHDISDVLIVVVRYFGGTLLGTSGLINAYRKSAEDALINAVFVEKFVCDTIDISFDFVSMNDVMKILKDDNLKILKQSCDEKCHIRFEVRKTKKDLIIGKIANISSITFNS